MSDVVSLVDEGLGNSSYLVDIGDGRAMVVDPARDPRPYLAAAERRNLSIAYAVETHLHADFISGTRELAALGAAVLAPAAAGLEFPARGLADGDEADLGGLRLRALGTPGHTPEHMAYLLLDGERPVGLFSGGSLLVGAVARTDLIAREETEPLARTLWRSLHEQVLSLPDHVVVYPTHGAGSFCSAPAGGERTTTIGRERATNPLLHAADENSFVQLLLGGLGTYPPYFLRLRERNREGPHVYGPAPPPLQSLDVERVRRLKAKGAELVDVRPVEAFAAGHVPGSLANPLRPQFATWLGWLVDENVPLVFIRDPDQDASEIVRQALGIGYECVAGELAGGVAAWEAAGMPLAQLEAVRVAEVSGAVLDIRQHSEFGSGHIPGAINVELGELRVAAERVAAGPVAVMCAHGERAVTGASLLERAGRRDVRVVVGGPDDWAAHHGPLERHG